jgi:MFS family permease
VVDVDRADVHRAAGTSTLVGALFVAVVAFAIQQTSIVPAVETVQRSLGASGEWSAWLVTVYLIVATVATPAMGRLGDLHGRRRMLLTGLLIFVAGSIGAALSPNMAVLIVFRALQGIGGAVYPLCLALARDNVSDHDVTKVVGLLTGGFGLGTAIGFVGGGLLAADASWRWIFAGGAIVVAIATALVFKIVPDSGAEAEGGYDLTGTVILTTAVVGLLAALTLIVPLGWGSPVPLVLFAVAVAGSLAWLRIESTRDDPLVDVHVLGARPVAVANLATIGLGWALFSTYLLVPQFTELDPGPTGFGLGGSAVTVGLVLLPLAVGQTIAGPVAGAASSRVTPRTLFAAGLAAVAVALGLMCLVYRNIAATALLMLLLGVGAGAALETSSAVATQGVADDVAAVSSAVNSTVRRLAGGLGGQISTIVLASVVVVSTGDPAHGAFVTCYLIAVALAVGGLVLILASHRQSDD